MLMTLSGIVTFSSEVQPLKALSPTAVTPSGITTSLSPVSPAYIALLMTVIFAGRVIFSMLLSPLKTFSPADSRPAGRTISVRVVQPANAFEPIFVMPEGIFTSVSE